MEKKFRCNSFSFRYSEQPNQPSDNCLLSTKFYRDFNPYVDFVPDRDFDIYEKNEYSRPCLEDVPPKITQPHTTECFLRVRSGQRLNRPMIKDAINVQSIGECELECLKAKFYTCRTFSFRYGSPVIGGPLENCELSDWPFSELDAWKDLVEDLSFILYERGSYGHGCEINHYIPYPEDGNQWGSGGQHGGHHGGQGAIGHPGQFERPPPPPIGGPHGPNRQPEDPWPNRPPGDRWVKDPWPPGQQGSNRPSGDPWPKDPWPPGQQGSNRPPGDPWPKDPWPPGPQGPNRPPGDPWPPGQQGSNRPPGDPWPPGPQGPNRPPGDPWQPGQQGSNRPPGDPWPPGHQGQINQGGFYGGPPKNHGPSNRPPGDDRWVKDPWPPGPQGPNRPPGDPWPPGQQGSNRPPGDPWPKDPWPPGPQGPNRPPGDPWPPGQQGSNRPPGDPWPKDPWPPGPQGPNRPPGDPWPPGQQGPNRPPGDPWPKDPWPPGQKGQRPTGDRWDKDPWPAGPHGSINQGGFYGGSSHNQGSNRPSGERWDKDPWPPGPPGINRPPGGNFGGPPGNMRPGDPWPQNRPFGGQNMRPGDPWPQTRPSGGHNRPPGDPWPQNRPSGGPGPDRPPGFNGGGSFNQGSSGHGYRKPTDQLCYIGYGGPAKLVPSAVRSGLTVPNEEECKAECSKAREKHLFHCTSLSFFAPKHHRTEDNNCLLSDISQRDLRPGLDYSHEEDNWMFAWNVLDPQCDVRENNQQNYQGHFYPGRDDMATWQRFSVSGKPCRAGTTCTENREAGFWSCELEGGEGGSWDYCCRSGHQCGHSEGFKYPWCYVGSAAKDQWRPCSERYFPHMASTYGGPGQKGPEDSNPYGPPRYWPVAYLHLEGPQNASLGKPSDYDANKHGSHFHGDKGPPYEHQSFVTKPGSPDDNSLTFIKLQPFDERRSSNVEDATYDNHLDNNYRSGYSKMILFSPNDTKMSTASKIDPRERKNRILKLNTNDSSLMEEMEKIPTFEMVDEKVEDSGEITLGLSLKPLNSTKDLDGKSSMEAPTYKKLQPRIAPRYDRDSGAESVEQDTAPGWNWSKSETTQSSRVGRVEFVRRKVSRSEDRPQKSIK